MNKSSQHKIYEFEKFRLDTVSLMLYREAEEISLPPKAVETLLALVERRGEIVSKDELMKTIWTDAVVEETNLAKYLHLLRKTLGLRADGKPFIETFRRRGYRFNGEIVISNFLPDANPEKNGENFALIQASPTGSSGAIRESKTGKVVALADWRHESEAEKTLKAGFSAEQVKEISSSMRGKIFAFGVIGLIVLALTFFAVNWFRFKTPAKSAPLKTIAILPFKPIAAENRDEVLEIGMADTLITRLSDNREIIVNPLSSVRKYSNLEQDAMQAGRELGVDSVLDGSVQRRNNKIRVNVRLIKVADGNLLWTATFDEKFTDIFVVQDTISRKVASALALQLTGDEQRRLEKRYTNDAEAYELYLRARFYYFKLTPPDVRKSVEYYQQAIDADPNYALAFAGMADAYRTMAIAAHAPAKEVCPKAKALATRALEIDDSLADAYVVLGWIGFLYDWDWENAERQLKRAIELAPNNSEAYRAYAHLLSSAGRHEEAIAESKKAVELAPLTLITATLDAYFLLYAGRSEEAVVRLNKTLELDTDFWAAHNALGRVYTIQERYEEAISEFKRARELAAASPEPITQLGYVLAKSGRRKEALVTLEELKSFAAEKYVPMYFFAVIHNGLGDKEKALEYLEKSLEEHEAQMNFIKVDTRWNNLRSEPRFIDLMKRMNFE